MNTRIEEVDIEVEEQEEMHPAFQEAKKPLPMQHLQIALLDDIANETRRSRELLEEQRADGRSKSIYLNVYGGAGGAPLRTYTNFDPLDPINPSSSFQTNGKHFVMIDFVTGAFSGIPSGVMVYIPYKKLFALEIVNYGPGDVQFSPNEEEGNMEANILVKGATGTWGSGMFQYPTIRRCSFVNVDGTNRDTTVQLIWST